MNFKRYKRLLTFFGICGCIFAHPSAGTTVINATSDINSLDAAPIANASYAINNKSYKKIGFATMDKQLVNNKAKSETRILLDTTKKIQN